MILEFALLLEPVGLQSHIRRLREVSAWPAYIALNPSFIFQACLEPRKPSNKVLMKTCSPLQQSGLHSAREKRMPLSRNQKDRASEGIQRSSDLSPYVCNHHQR